MEPVADDGDQWEEILLEVEPAQVIEDGSVGTLQRHREMNWREGESSQTTPSQRR